MGQQWWLTLQLRSREVDGRRMGRRPGADNYWAEESVHKAQETGYTQKHRGLVGNPRNNGCGKLKEAYPRGQVPPGGGRMGVLHILTTLLCMARVPRTGELRVFLKEAAGAATDSPAVLERNAREKANWNNLAVWGSMSPEWRGVGAASEWGVELRAFLCTAVLRLYGSITDRERVGSGVRGAVASCTSTSKTGGDISDLAISSDCEFRYNF